MRSQVQGDAAHTIASFPLTDDNYAHSVTLLQARCGQPHKLMNAHMEALLSLVVLSLEKPSNSLASLQVFHDTLEQHIRSLSSLGKSSEIYTVRLLIDTFFTKQASSRDQETHGS